MAPMNHDVSRNRLRIIKYTIGAFLILGLVELIVLTFIVPILGDFIIKAAESQSFGPSMGNGDHLPDPEMMKQMTDMVGKIVIGVLIVSILLQILFIWGIFKEIFGVVVAYAVINTIGLIVMIPTLFIAPTIFIPDFIFGLVPTILAYYMIHLMKKPPTSPVVVKYRV